MKRSARQLDKGAIELIEEAVHLLRRAPLPALAIYFAGSLPFVLALLYFWADMSRSPSAYEHLAGGAWGLGALFVWMKFCHSVFALRLRALLAGQPPPVLGFRRSLRVFAAQAAVQPTGLFLLPVALVLALPFAWVYAFFQNFTILDDGDGATVRSLIREAQKQTLPFPKQNHFLLAILFVFGVFVFLNWSILGLVLPGLVKSLLGVESTFSRSVFSLLNTTFFAVMIGLTYLSVDPIAKACYVLRCLYGQSRQSGEDLKSELRQQRLMAAPMTACVAFALVLFQPGPLSAAQTHLDMGLAETAPSPRPSPPSAVAETMADKKAEREPAQAEQINPSIPSPFELDHNIQEVLQQQKYTWRMPREKIEQPETGKGFLGRFLERVRKWLRSLRDWLSEWLRKFFLRRQKSDNGNSSGYGWILTLQLFLELLAVAVVVALGILIYRILTGRRQKPTILASEPIQPAPDVADENVGPDQLPEDGWSTLGRELLERGELRLALRAFYLGSLAHLASRQLISLARSKSNRDYERELLRRGHSFPELLSGFRENVQVFDRIWYGAHEINRDLVQQFLARVEQMQAQQS